MRTNLLISAAFVLLSTLTLGQKGPGGVSVESGSQSTCRAWLDASTLTGLADGDDLVVWPDVSLSANSDDAEPAPSELPPFFRDDPANTINGFPVVTFEDGRFLLLNSTADLNLANETFEKTVFFAFRTSTDVTSKQVLYEEGGCWRGLNIYIDGGQLYCGAYDLNSQGINNSGSGGPNGNGTDSGGTPQWGYSFVSTPIVANSTYILTMQFYAQNAGVRSTNTTGNNYYIRGWLNGQVFDVMDFNTSNLTNTNGSNTGVNGIGSLSAHPDPIGLGAINSDYVDHDGLDCNNTGANSFKGRLAELCYYNDRLTETQRIIIENYLGAKYFANIIVNDKYDHQALYGNEVIGIGQQTNSSANRHNLSQGRNPFLLEAPTSSFNAANKFFLTGHNGANLLYTSNDVPNNSPNIQRLQRIWRVNERNNFGNVTITVDKSDLPNPPTGYTKLVILIDESSPNFPNFVQNSTKVLELSPVTTNTFDITYDFPNDAFFTFAWLKPTVEFSLTESFGIESNPSPDSTKFTVDLNLNFLSVFQTFTIDYEFVDGSANSTDDYGYDYTDQTNGITFAVGSDQASLDVWIKNDILPEDPSTESFFIILQNGPNTTSDLQIGGRDTLIFSIYDDDPPPEVSFASSTSSALESESGIQVTLIRTGDDSGTSVARIRREPNPNQGTAIYGEDFTCQSADGWSGIPSLRNIELTFLPGVNTQTAFITFQDDIIDEIDETINLRVEPVSGISVDLGDVLEHTVSITDEDPEPSAAFLTDNQTGYESVGDPVLFIELDRPSTRDVTVYYSIIGGTATGGGTDYTAASTGSVLFQAGDTLAFISPFTVDNGDVIGEPDETVIFKLDSAQNASIGVIDEFTYTIIDTTPFEWKGAAGVGKDSDNIVWIDADRMSGSGLQQSLTNFSPRDIDVSRKGGNGNRAELRENMINGRKAIDFDGNGNSNQADCYVIDDNSFTNLAGFVEKKSYFFVIRPDNDGVPTQNIPISNNSNVEPTTSHARLIYEQGAGVRGISIYLYDEYLWLHAWNDNNDGPESPWGYSGNTNSTVWARSANTITGGQTYVVSCHFDNKSSEPLMVYVNGEKGIMSSNIVNANDVGRLYAHGGDVGLGAVTNGCRFHFTRNDANERSCAFKGLIAEFIKFHEPQMSDTRRTIIENYLSAKYDVVLSGSGTDQVFDLSFASGSNTYNNAVAGVGRLNSEVHLDAQGNSILRVQDPIFNGSADGFLIWGHNGESLTNTWPFSYWNSDLPSPVQERSGQVWRFSETAGNPISTVDVLINFSSSTNADTISQDPSLLKLLVHSNSDPSDFSNATIYDATSINSGYVADFADVPLDDGDYIALGNTSSITNLPLPIELLSFSARMVGTYVDINWSTASEINNDYFVVERAGEDLVWEPILTVDGAGNSNTLLTYREKDREPLKGVSYYRLKQVDFDGQYSYSETVSVFNGQVRDSEDVFMYPNPSKQGSVFLRIPFATRDYRTTATMFDMSGKQVYSELIDTASDIHEFRYGSLTPGIYFIQISSEAISETKKLVVE